MKKEIKLEHVGYETRGESFLTMWGGGEGSIEMNDVFIPDGKLSKTALLSCVNDARFGCESIDSAYIDIYDVYGDRNDYKEFNRTIFIDEDMGKKYSKLFCRGI